MPGVVPGDTGTCPACAAQHQDCCTYEADLDVAQLRCPHPFCREVGQIAEVDTGYEQHNTLTVPDDHRPGDTALHASLGDSDPGDGEGYVCTACMEPVDLPAGWTIETWD